AHLARGLARRIEQRHDVRALRTLLPALDNATPEPRGEAGAGAGVAGGPRRQDAKQNRVAVAILADLLDGERAPGRLALVPVLPPRARPEPRFARLARASERLVVHPGEHQHAAVARVLDDRGLQLRIGHPASRSSAFSSTSRSGRSCTIDAISAAEAPASNASAR